jgi:isopentenyl diphosphate isomerase/L-lactate dehydrogenase-like FMN-dependent dehydrogenase
MVSTGSSVPLEQILAQRGAPVWQQLYPTDDWRVARELVRRAASAGADAVIVSNHGGRNEETPRATIDCVPE